MSLSQCKAEISPREYRLWLYWLDKQWEVPDRSDFYLMQIAEVIANTNSSRKRKPFQLKDFVLKPEKPKKKQEIQETPEQSVQRWVAFLNSSGGPKVRIKGKDI